MFELNKTLLITLSLVSILFIIIFFLIGSIIFKKNKKINFSLFQNFPYEINFFEDIKSDLIFKSLIFIGPLLFIGVIPSNYLFVKNTQLESSTFYLVNSIIYLLSFIGTCSLVLTNLKETYKIHFISLVVSLGLNALALIGFVNFTFNFNFYDIKSIIFCVIVSIYILGIFLFIFLSKDKLIKLDTEVNENGTIISKRPKVFRLALLEWVLFLGNFLYILLNLIEFVSI